MEKRKFKGDSLRTHIILATFGFFIGFLLVEVLLRMLNLPWLTNRMEILNVGVRDIAFGSDANWHVEISDNKIVRLIPFSKTHLVHYEYNIVANIDEFGGRRTVTNPTAIKSNIIIPFMGDSFAFGLGVEDEQTFISLLGEESKFQYINLGLPGSALPEQLDVVEKRHKELGSPRVYIFIFFTGNDYYFINQDKQKDKNWEQLDFSKNKLYSWLWKVNNYVYHNPFLKKIYTIQFLKAKILIIVNAAIKRKKGEMLLIEPIFLVMYKKNLPELEKFLDFTLNRLISDSQRFSFKSIFIIIPDRIQVSPALLKLKLKYYGWNKEDIDPGLPNKVLRKKLQQANIPYFDVFQCLYNKKEKLYYIQDNHLTAKGHRFIARCIGKELEKLISSMLDSR